MSVRIVTHAYAKQLPQYGVYLGTQLSSLLHHWGDSTFKTHITVCCDPSDTMVCDVLNVFDGKIDMDVIYLEPQYLFKRSIGRNQAALASKEDLVWFADVDYYFGPNSLHRLWKTYLKWEGPKPTFMWPKKIVQHVKLEYGDEFYKQQWVKFQKNPLDVNSYKPKLSDNIYHTKGYTKPIGGMQIVPGHLAREHGYLNSIKKWQEPVPEQVDTPFRYFRDDFVFRKYYKELGYERRIHIPNVYRFRHSNKTHR